MKIFSLFARRDTTNARSLRADGPLPASSRMANIGCGAVFHPGWDNFDFTPIDPGVRKIDLARPIPFKPATYGTCYLSHVLEHLSRQRVPSLLGEIWQSLQPGGVLRIVVPDLEVIAQLYLRELLAAAAATDDEAYLRHEWMTLELIDQMTRTFSGGFMGRTLRSRPLPHREFIEKRIGWEGKHWLESVDRALQAGSEVLPPAEVYRAAQPEGAQEAVFRRSGEVHRWMYDRVSLRRILEESGYINITVCRADESRIPKFANYNLDTDESGSVRKPDSLFMEASKPA